MLNQFMTSTWRSKKDYNEHQTMIKTYILKGKIIVIITNTQLTEYIFKLLSEIKPGLSNRHFRYDQSSQRKKTETLVVRLNAAFSRFSWKNLEDCMSIFDHPLITKLVLGAL